MPFMFKT